MKYIIRGPAGEKHEVGDLEAVREWIADGRIDERTVFFDPDSGTWHWASELAEIQKVLSEVPKAPTDVEPVASSTRPLRSPSNPIRWIIQSLLGVACMLAAYGILRGFPFSDLVGPTREVLVIGGTVMLISAALYVSRRTIFFKRPMAMLVTWLVLVGGAIGWHYLFTLAPSEHREEFVIALRAIIGGDAVNLESITTQRYGKYAEPLGGLFNDRQIQTERYEALLNELDQIRYTRVIKQPWRLAPGEAELTLEDLDRADEIIDRMRRELGTLKNYPLGSVLDQSRVPTRVRSELSRLNRNAGRRFWRLVISPALWAEEDVVKEIREYVKRFSFDGSVIFPQYRRAGTPETFQFRIKQRIATRDDRRTALLQALSNEQLKEYATAQSDRADTTSDRDKSFIRVESVTRVHKPVIETVTAAGGQILVVQLQAVPKVSAFDVSRGAFVHSYGCLQPHSVFGAGGERLIIYHYHEKEFMLYSLTDGKRMARSRDRFGEMVQDIVMGASNDDVALVRFAHAASGRSRSDVAMIQGDTLERMFDGINPLRMNSLYQDSTIDVQFRADSMIETILEVSTDNRHDDVALHTFSGTDFESRHASIGASWFTPGDDGFIYTGDGRVVDLELEVSSTIPGHALIPGVGGDFFLAIDDEARVKLVASGSSEPIADIGPYPGNLDLPKDEMRLLRERITGGGSLAFDRRVIFDPTRNRATFVSLDDMEIIVCAISISEILDKSARYAVAAPIGPVLIELGQTWMYRPTVYPDGAAHTVELVKGPSTMSIDESGRVTWQAIAERGSSKSVVLRIVDATGRGSRHSIKLHIR